MKRRVAILISGRGSNMAALIDAARLADFPAEIVAVISNRADAAGLATIADFRPADWNDDGRTDILFRHATSGRVVVWLMNGLSVLSVGFPGSASTEFEIAGVGDVNGDGKADLVWRNTSDGNTAIWLMNGTTIVSSGFPAGMSVAWQIAQVGDVNGDGKADVIWRNDTSGTVAVWLMNGLAITDVGFPGSASLDWEIQ